MLGIEVKVVGIVYKRSSELWDIIDDTPILNNFFFIFLQIMIIAYSFNHFRHPGYHMRFFSSLDFDLDL